MSENIIYVLYRKNHISSKLTIEGDLDTPELDNDEDYGLYVEMLAQLLARVVSTIRRIFSRRHRMKA